MTTPSPTPLMAALQELFQTLPGDIQSAFYTGPVRGSLLTCLHAKVGGSLAFAPTDATFLEAFDSGDLASGMLEAPWFEESMITFEGSEPAHLWIWDAPLTPGRLARNLDRAERCMLPNIILLGCDAVAATGDDRYRWEKICGLSVGYRDPSLGPE